MQIDHPEFTVEEALLAAEKKAAMLRYLTQLASGSPEAPDPKALLGLCEVAEDIEGLIRAALSVLPVDATTTALSQRRRR